MNVNIMENINVLYVRCYENVRILLAINPNTDNETAINTIAKIIKEHEMLNVNEQEYYEESGLVEDDFLVMARDIWFYNNENYIDIWENNYGIAKNVNIL